MTTEAADEVLQLLPGKVGQEGHALNGLAPQETDEVRHIGCIGRKGAGPGDQVEWNDPDAGFSTGVYRVIDAIGTSKTYWEDAARQAVNVASKSLRDLRIAEVTKMDMKVENGKVVAYRTRVQLSFKYEG